MEIHEAFKCINSAGNGIIRDVKKEAADRAIF